MRPDFLASITERALVLQEEQETRGVDGTAAEKVVIER